MNLLLLLNGFWNHQKFSIQHQAYLKCDPKDFEPLVMYPGRYIFPSLYLESQFACQNGIGDNPGEPSLSCLRWILGKKLVGFVNLIHSSDEKNKRADKHFNPHAIA